MWSRIYRISILLLLIFKLYKCDTNGIVTVYSTDDVEPSDGKGDGFPSTQYCGVYKKNNVIDHTWLVRLKYANDEYGCGGAVINSRYILTAASCVTGDIVDKLGNVTVATLFENTGDRLNKDYKIEETVVHAKYIPNSIHGQYDVALIRVANKIDQAVTTPICTDGYEAIDRELTPYVEGWGQSYQGQVSTIRQLLEIKFVSTAECTNLFSPYNYEVTTLDVCTALKPKDYDNICPVDGGGVLVNKNKSRWWLLGIAPYNALCGNHQRPGIFIKYHKVFTWVQNNMRP